MGASVVVSNNVKFESLNRITLFITKNIFTSINDLNDALLVMPVIEHISLCKVVVRHRHIVTGNFVENKLDVTHYCSFLL